VPTGNPVSRTMSEIEVLKKPLWEKSIFEDSRTEV
jgi:hypothetical protein